MNSSGRTENYRDWFRETLDVLDQVEVVSLAIVTMFLLWIVTIGQGGQVERNAWPEKLAGLVLLLWTALSLTHDGLTNPLHVIGRIMQATIYAGFTMVCLHICVIVWKRLPSLPELPERPEKPRRLSKKQREAQLEQDAIERAAERRREAEEQQRATEQAQRDAVRQRLHQQRESVRYRVQLEFETLAQRMPKKNNQQWLNGYFDRYFGPDVGIDEMGGRATELIRKLHILAITNIPVPEPAKKSPLMRLREQFQLRRKEIEEAEFDAAVCESLLAELADIESMAIQDLLQGQRQ